MRQTVRKLSTDGNTAVSNDRSIQTTVTSASFIVRNHAENNGTSASDNCVLLGTQSVGSIITTTGTITTTNPWANFSF